MFSNNITINLKGGTVSAESYADGYGQGLSEKNAMKEVDTAWSRMGDFIGASVLFGVILFYGTANWVLALAVAILCVFLVIILSLRRVKRGLEEYDRVVARRAVPGPPSDQTADDPTQVPVAPQRPADDASDDEVYVSDGICRRCKLPIEYIEISVFDSAIGGPQQLREVVGHWEHEDTDVDEDHRAEPEDMPLTLGKLSDVLQDWKNKGVTHQSITYAMERVYADVFAKEKRMADELRRIFQMNAEVLQDEVQKAADASDTGFVRSTADGKIVPLNNIEITGVASASDLHLSDFAKDEEDEKK